MLAGERNLDLAVDGDFVPGDGGDVFAVHQIRDMHPHKAVGFKDFFQIHQIQAAVKDTLCGMKVDVLLPFFQIIDLIDRQFDFDAVTGQGVRFLLPDLRLDTLCYILQITDEVGFGNVKNPFPFVSVPDGLRIFADVNKQSPRVVMDKDTFKAGVRNISSKMKIWYSS